MSASAFIQRQIAHVRSGGRPVFYRKLRKALGIVLSLPFYVLAVPVVLVCRLIRPWLLIRMGTLKAHALGHFAAETELYLCERDAGICQPGRRHLDLFRMRDVVPNRQLTAMWRRVLHIWPNWIMVPLDRVDRLMPGAAIPSCGIVTQEDRDVHNLLDRVPPHLAFTPEEEARGKSGLRAMGIPQGRPFVCLNVRDDAYYTYFNQIGDSSDVEEDRYRDGDIQSFILAAETLADRGYIVIRMGAMVRAAMKTSHPGVIDYAANGMRSDFMDVYLGAKCEFCISTGTGFDAVPTIFRRPVAYANMVPVGNFDSYSARIIGITRHYCRASDNGELSLAEIFERGVGFFYFASEYRAAGIRLIANSPEEIRDLAVEMAERLRGSWRAQDDDEALQKRFWKILPRNAPGLDGGRPWHGEIRSRYGTAFLRANRGWLQ